MNPIKYSDLIVNDNQSFASLITGLANANKGLEKLMATARENAVALKEALGQANPATSGGQAEIVRLIGEIDALQKKIKELEQAVERNKQTQREANAITATTIRQKLEQKEAVRELTNVVKEQMATEKLDEEQMERLSKQSNIQTMSYNQLSSAYSQLKAKINEMTAATKEEVAARERLAGVARQVYEQMNTLQQQTGKYTLQVGNYAKSWNGLNIAMQQIVRETPNLAMGFNTFFLAISNNIPILTDQIKIAKDKYAQDAKDLAMMKAQGAAIEELRAKEAGMIPVRKQIISSLFSWQTAMVAGVALMTMFGAKLIELAAGWIKTRRGIDEAKVSLEAFNNAMDVGLKAGAEETAKLDVLYKAATDLNMAMNDRLDAVKSLKSLWPDVFSGLTNEAILVGDAKNAYDELSKSLFKVAQAQAAMNLLTEIAGKKIQAQADINTAQAIANGVGYSSIDDLYAAQQKNNLIWNLRKLSQSDRQAFRKGRKAVAQLAEYEAQEKGIIGALAVDDLLGMFTDDKSGGRSARTKQESVGDYYWQGLESMIKAMDEGLGKALANLSVSYAKAREEYRADEEKLLEQMKSSDSKIAAEAEAQLKNLQVLVAAAENEYQQERARLISEMLDSYYEDVADEGNIEEQVRKRVETELKVEKELMTSEMYMLFEQKKITQEELNEKLARINNDYWYEYAHKLLDMGDIQGYNDAMGRIKEGDGEEEEGGLLERLFGKIDKGYLRGLERVARMAVGYIADIIDAYHELAQAAVEAAEKQVAAAEKVYDAELGAYQNGYANNVEFARKELALRKEKLAEAQAVEERYRKMQEAAETAEQAVTMASAIAYLFKSASKAGILGIPIATAASAALVATFTASKIMAAQAAKQKVEFGEGMHEYLDYGGSHASGNDIDFGTTKDGRRRTVERGEMIAVFNKRNTDKYGSETLANLVDSINRGTFEKDYLSVFSGGSFNGAIIMNQFPSGVSDDISAIRRSTENQRYVAGNGTIIERYRNRTRIIHQS